MIAADVDAIVLGARLHDGKLQSLLNRWCRISGPYGHRPNTIAPPPAQTETGRSAACPIALSPSFFLLFSFCQSGWQIVALRVDVTGRWIYLPAAVHAPLQAAAASRRRFGHHGN